MLAYTAGDSLNAITRTFGIGSHPTIINRSEPSTQGKQRRAGAALRAFYGRAVGRILAPNRS